MSEGLRVVYIAGPYRGASQWEVKENIRRAEYLASWVWGQGAVALCPHLNTAFFEGLAEDEVWLRGDLELLRRCDAVLLTPDWMNSEGAREERRVAEELGMPVFEDTLEFTRWLRGPVYKVGFGRLARRFTASVRVTGVRRWTFKARLGLWLVRLGVRVTGMGFEFEGVDVVHCRGGHG